MESRKEIERVALYARVSTRRQKNEDTIENQIIELKRYCKQSKLKVFKVYADNGYSGACDSRPQLNKLLRDSEAGKFDAVVVLRLDRLGRSLTHLIETVEKLKEMTIDFVSVKENIDTISGSGRLVFHIFCAIAEFERGLIRERIQSGMRRKKEEGKVFGHKPKLRNIERVYQLSEKGLSTRKIARKVKLSRTRISQLLKEKHQIKHLLIRGRSIKKIALECGIQEPRVKKIADYLQRECQIVSRKVIPALN